MTWQLQPWPEAHPGSFSLAISRHVGSGGWGVSHQWLCLAFCGSSLICSTASCGGSVALTVLCCPLCVWPCRWRWWACTTPPAVCRATTCASAATTQTCVLARKCHALLGSVLWSGWRSCCVSGATLWALLPYSGSSPLLPCIDASECARLTMIRVAHDACRL